MLLQSDHHKHILVLGAWRAAEQLYSRPQFALLASQVERLKVLADYGV